MSYGYNTSANQTRNKNYNYSPSQAPQSIASGSENFNYSEIYDSRNANTSANQTKNRSSKPTAVGPWGITMGQTQNFTLFIESICNADNAFTLLSKNGPFLPLKTLEYKPVSLEHLKIKAGVFSDLPFLHRRKMGTLSCVMLDSSKSQLSQKVFQWFNSCVSTGGYVPYVDEMCKNAEYIEYTHDGKKAITYKFAVLPDVDFSVGRSYEGDGALTEYKFNLIIVSDIQTFRNGKWVEADWGDGGDDNADYERRVYGEVKGVGTITDPAIKDYLGYK